MRRIAHLSDVHLLDVHAEAKRARYRFATRLVSTGRGVDPRVRRRRLSRALAIAKASGADHFVISGDLTEVGADEEFEQFAEVLSEARLPEDSVTLVPGNHDAYTANGAWERAIRGPLARFAAASATVAGKIVDRDAVAFLPIDTSRFQSIARASGEFTRAAADAVTRRLVDPALRDKALVMVLHHPPIHPNAFMRLFDGLRGCAQLVELLVRHPRLQLLHGHLHRVVDRMVPSPKDDGAQGGAHAQPPHTRVFGAPATCDGPDEAPRIRLYDVTDGKLCAVPPVSPPALEARIARGFAPMVAPMVAPAIAPMTAPLVAPGFAPAIAPAIARAMKGA